MEAKRTMTAEYLRGFEEGARAATHRRIKDSLFRYWFDHKGLVLPPGSTQIRTWTMEEWAIFVDALCQRVTGHNHLDRGAPW